MHYIPTQQELEELGFKFYAYKIEWLLPVDIGGGKNIMMSYNEAYGWAFFAPFYPKDRQAVGSLIEMFSVKK